MKRILFIAICLIIAGEASAQRYPRRVVRRPPPPPPGYYHQKQHNDFYRVKVGIKGGFNFANTIDAYDSDWSTGTLTGANVGLTFEIPVTYPLSFQPEILYSQKGFKNSDIYGDFKQRNHFIDIPLLAKLKITPGLNFEIGPQLSFLLSSTNTYRDGNVLVIEDYDYRGNRTLLGGVIGFSVDLNRSVDLHARYTIDLQDSNTGRYSDIPDFRNQVWQLGLGFKFR